MRKARPVAGMRQEIADRQHGAGREAHVLRHHRRMVVAAARQIGDQFGVGERVRIDRLQFPMLGDRRGLVRLVPVAQLLAPELLPKTCSARSKRAGISASGAGIT